MAVATTTRITDDTGVRFFHELRITGLPYRFYSAVNPYSSTYGSNAWTLPTDVTAVRGLMLPDDSMTQGLKDITGGFATPEKIRVQLVDFDAHDSAGTYKYLGRLFAIGRALSSTAVTTGYLNADLSASTTDAGTFTARAKTVIPAGYVYLPAETIDTSTSVLASGIDTFTIDTSGRNKWPCYTSADGATTWPPVPYYRVGGGASAIDREAAAPRIASEPFTVVGRTCALYLGHMMPAGDVPEAEAQRLCLTVGRIMSMRYEGGLFELEIESVMADLDSQACAPDMATASIPEQISIPDTDWGTLQIGCYAEDAVGNVTSQGYVALLIGASTYPTLQDVCNELNRAMSTWAESATTTYGLIKRCEPKFGVFVSADGKGRAGLQYVPKAGPASSGLSDKVLWLALRHNRSKIKDPSASPVEDGTMQESLLCALGFPTGESEFRQGGMAADVGLDDTLAGAGSFLYIVAEAEPYGVFIPTSSYINNVINIASSGAISGTDAAPGQRFFTAQAADEPSAWVRFGDGQIVQLHAKSGTTLGTRNANPMLLEAMQELDGKARSTFYYAVPRGQGGGTVEQVLVCPDPGTFLSPTDNAKFIGRLICSDWNATVDGEYDVYPEGVGMGMNTLMDKASMRLGYGTAPPSRIAVIDRTTKLKDLWEPIGKETHTFLVWDADSERFAMRRLLIPSSASAETYRFTDSNRMSPNDVTRYDEDFTMVRVGWTIKYAWHSGEKKLMREIGFTDQSARSMFQVAAKIEEIKDPTLVRMSTAAEVLAGLASGSVYYRYPWVRCARSINRTALALSPGTVHQVVDATIHNPYTGAFGITAGDAVYGLLTEVTRNPATGDCFIEFLIPPVDYGNLRPWSPTALVDVTANTPA